MSPYTQFENPRLISNNNEDYYVAVNYNDEFVININIDLNDFDEWINYEELEDLEGYTDF